MNTVSNSSPLIYLAANSDFELLRGIFGEILIPQAVWWETVDQGQGFPVRQSVLAAAAAGWLKVQGTACIAETIPAGLHQGEAEAIQLAREVMRTLC